MRIQYKPLAGETKQDHVFTGTQWAAGEIKEIDDDLKFRRYGQQVRWTDDLLSSPAFVLADTGRNPNFTCARCQGPALEDSYRHPMGYRVDFDIDGARVCSGCFYKERNGRTDALPIVVSPVVSKPKSASLKISAPEPASPNSDAIGIPPDEV